MYWMSLTEVQLTVTAEELIGLTERIGAVCVCVCGWVMTSMTTEKAPHNPPSYKSSTFGSH